MKKYITVAALFAAGTACMHAEEIKLTLPSTAQATAGNGGKTINVSANDASGISAMAGLADGLYMFCNGGQTGVGGAGAETEGMWTYDASEKTASVELWGRKNWGGTNVAAIFDGGLTTGLVLDSLTFKTTGLTGGTDDYAVYFGVVDQDGDILASDVQNNLGTSAAEITLSTFGTSDTLTWGDGYSLLVGIVSEAGSAWNTKTYVNGISVTATIPEPSAFGLLAGLGALALVGARRRRR